MNFFILLAHIILTGLLLVFNNLLLIKENDFLSSQNRTDIKTKELATSLKITRSPSTSKLIDCVQNCKSQDGFASKSGRLSMDSGIEEAPQVHPFGRTTFGSDVILSFTGDVMLGSALHSNKLHKEYLLASKDFFDKSDLNFVNLEGPIGNENLFKFAKTCSSKNCHTFSQLEESADFLRSQNIHVVALNNNHALDLSKSGLINSKAVLERSGLLAITGSAMLDSLKLKDNSLENYLNKNNQQVHNLDLKRMAPTQLEVDSVKFSIFNLSSSKQMAQIDDKGILEQVSAASSDGRVVIVYAHVGCEGAPFMSMPKVGKEQCFSEQRPNAFEMADKFRNAGAKIIVFHGPHVVRPIVKSKDSIIAYSLGNFATAPGISVAGAAGLAPLLQVGISKTGSVSWCKIISFKQQRGQGLYLDNALEAKKVIERLTEEQFEHQTGCS